MDTQAATVEQQQMGDLMLIIEKLTSVITRGEVYQGLYQLSATDTLTGKAVNNLYNSMVLLYTTMLQMIALCHRLLTKNTARRAAHAFLNPNEVSEFLSKCEQLETRADREASNCDRTRSQEADTTVINLVQKVHGLLLGSEDITSQNTQSLLIELKEEECQKILGWTSNIHYGANHQLVKEQRAVGTCGWLLRHNDYLMWQDARTSSILWLCGTGEL
jgi:hypothetical protein